PSVCVLTSVYVEMITSASEYLFQALDKLLFFKEVKILVPPNWSGTYVRTRKETYDKGPNVHMVMNKQIKGCGEESEYIHFTPNFLLNDDLLNAYGPRGRIFVHEWAHLRWVVFDEYNESHSTCLTTMSRKQGQLVTTFSTHAVIFQDSVDKDDLQTLTPLQFPPPPPNIQHDPEATSGHLPHP
uniref:Calcium-activated chloride channel N-terminal domain-containing protein n=1 Tax=Pygocentrus nattereri TaxID=42514 RepID=A0AAR2KCV8_PYGNA